VQPGVADVAPQDRQLQRVLPGGVAQPSEDLAGRRARRGVHGRADQDQATDSVGMPHGQLDRDLAAEGVAQHRHRWQVGRLQPGGQMVGMLGDPQHPARVAAEAEAGHVDHVHPVMAGKPQRQRHHVAVRDGQPVEQDQRRSDRRGGNRAAVMGRGPSDRPPSTPEPPDRAGGAGRQPVPVKGHSKDATGSGRRPQPLMAELH
jgi:hypothetical protein